MSFQRDPIQGGGGESVTVPRGGSSHKFWGGGGVRFPGGCLTSTSGCPGAAGDPRRDLPPSYGKELGTSIPRPGPCIPHPAPCILPLGSLHPGPRISASLIPALLSSRSSYPKPCSFRPCIPGPCNPHPPTPTLPSR